MWLAAQMMQVQYLAQTVEDNNKANPAQLQATSTAFQRAPTPPLEERNQATENPINERGLTPVNLPAAVAGEGSNVREGAGAGAGASVAPSQPTPKRNAKLPNNPNLTIGNFEDIQVSNHYTIHNPMQMIHMAGRG